MSESTKPTLNEAECGNKSKPLLSTVVLSPTEFYEKQFPDDANLLKGLQNTPFFSFTAMVQFTELYANYLRSVQL